MRPMKIIRIEKGVGHLECDAAFGKCDCGYEVECKRCGGTGAVYAPFICPLDCEEGFETPEDLEQHLIDVHQTVSSAITIH